MKKLPFDKLRVGITFASALFLAFAAQTALSGLFASDNGEPGLFTLEVIGEGIRAAAPGELWVKGVFVDGRLLRWRATDQNVGWAFVDNHGQAPYLLYRRHSEPAVLTAHGRRLVAVLEPLEWSGVISLKRDGRTVRIMDVRPSPGQQVLLAIEYPLAPCSSAVFLGALLLFAGCAWWFGPLRVDSKCIPWLVFFVVVLHTLYWSSHPVGSNSDIGAYLNTVRQVFVDGEPSSFPPGYPALLGLVGALSGHSLGAWITLVQHGMAVLGALWLYLILRRLVSEPLALLGGILAGTVAPCLISSQAVLSESATSFAMVGAFYFAVRSNETGKLLFAVLAGAFIGWGGTLRVVPLPALFPAVCILCLFSSVKNRFRCLSVTATVATVVMVLPGLWCAYKSGHAKLASSLGSHLYNRVIKEQKLINVEGPATLRLLSLMGGKNPTDFEHWGIREQRGVQALSYEEQELLLRNVALEGIYKSPWEFLAYTPRLAWRIFMAPTNWIATWPDTDTVVESVENPPPLALTAATLTWYWFLDDIHRALWPVLCWAAVAGTLLGLLGNQRPLVLALAWVPAGHLLATAFVEYFLARYNAPIVPFVIVLAMLPLDIIPRKIREAADGWASYRSGFRQLPDASEKLTP